MHRINKELLGDNHFIVLKKTNLFRNKIWMLHLVCRWHINAYKPNGPLKPKWYGCTTIFLTNFPYFLPGFSHVFHRESWEMETGHNAAKSPLSCVGDKPCYSFWQWVRNGVRYRNWYANSWRCSLPWRLLALFTLKALKGSYWTLRKFLRTSSSRFFAWGRRREEGNAWWSMSKLSSF